MLEKLLATADLFQGLQMEKVRMVASLAKPRSLRTGEYLFLLGDTADRLYVVVEGKLDLCFPMSLGEAVRDISVEAVIPGQTLGWSALVKPYRFTLSARAAETSRLIGLSRQDLLTYFDGDSQTGYLILTRISELVGYRLLTVQALWARGLQRTLEAESSP